MVQLVEDRSDSTRKMLRVQGRHAVNATVLVAHSSPVVAAGLTAVLRRLQGCDVRTLDAKGETSAIGTVVVVDDLSIAACFAMCRGATAEPTGAAAPKVVLLTPDTREADAASMVRKGVSAWLSLDCPEEELLAAVQGLLRDAPQIRWAPPIEALSGPRWAPNPAAGARRRGLSAGLSPGALRKVRQHIEARFAQKIQLDQLARVAGLSTSYFSRVFKTSIGMAPHRYVLMRRLAAASELIRKTDKPLAQVAVEAGFSDQSHFTRMFVRMTGETPSHLRRRYR